MSGYYGPRQSYFNPRSPRGGATPSVAHAAQLYANFNPRSPRGGATPQSRRRWRSSYDFNPRSPRGGATASAKEACARCKISIHAPHEGERPQRTRLKGQAAGEISIHAPHEGERPSSKPSAVPAMPFQSTLPTRGSDYAATGSAQAAADI